MPSGLNHQDKFGVVMKKTIPEVIERQNVGYLKFIISRKVTISDALRIEIVKRSSSFFQIFSGTFAVKNKRSMTTAWFQKRLGKGKVLWSWLVYAPVKSAVF